MTRRIPYLNLIGPPALLVLIVVVVRQIDATGEAKLLLALAGSLGAIGLDYLGRAAMAGQSGIERAVRFVVLVVGFIFSLSALAGLLALFGAPAPTPGSEASLSEDGTALVAILAITGLVIGSQAKAVGYRWSDTFMALIPLYGLLFFIPKTLWRMSALPQTPWDGSRANQHVSADTGPSQLAQMPALPPPPSP